MLFSGIARGVRGVLEYPPGEPRANQLHAGGNREKQYKVVAAPNSNRTCVG